MEILAHAEISPDDLPVTFALLEVHCPDDLAAETVAGLPLDWQSNPAASRAIGDRWLAKGATPLLHVPSALVVRTVHTLINPDHPASGRIRIAAIHRQPLDLRRA